MGHLAYTVQVATRVARAADGIAIRQNLLDASLSSHDVRTLNEIGHLRPVFPGVYLVGADRLSHRQLQRAATLVAPGRAWLGARSSLELRKVLWTYFGHVVLYTTARIEQDSLQSTVPMFDDSTGRVQIERLVRRPPAQQVAGLPATCVPRSLVDLAALEGSKMLGIAWREAESRGLLDLSRLDAELGTARRPGQDALAALVSTRRVLTTADTDLRSKAELLLLHMIKEAGLPMPQVNVPMRINGQQYIADFFFEDFDLVLELDSPDHLKPAAGARDRVRDVDFFVAGLDVIRFLDSAVVADPPGYMERLRAALARQRARRSRAA